MGKLAEYKSCQNYPEARILDDRPTRDQIPPPSLLYKGFGLFMDSYRRRVNDWLLSQHQRELEAAVDNFADEMTRIHKNDGERRESGLLALNGILSIHGLNMLAAASIDSSRIQTDGHNVGSHGAVSFIIEFKNEAVDISSIPEVELASYVAHSHGCVIQRNKELYMRWRVPCLGLTIVGKLDISWSSDESDIMYI